MTLTDDAGAGPLAVIHRLLEATNKHDLESLAECFAPGYVNETPAHPTRGFTGRDTIRSNWEQLGLAGGVTISFGIADYRTDASAERLLNRADVRLYEAKHGGRNLVVA